MSLSHRVLVVDDHPDTVTTLGMLVRALGHECVEATTGADALLLASEREFDLALIDLGLPDLSGHDVARSLRELPAGRTMYLVALTGYGRPEHQRRALTAGFNRHVLKPIDAAIIRQLIWFVHSDGLDVRNDEGRQVAEEHEASAACENESAPLSCSSAAQRLGVRR